MNEMMRRLAGASTALIWCLTAGCGANTGEATAPDTVAVDPTSTAVPLIMVDESLPATWTYGGLKADPDDELEIAGIPGVVALPGRRYLIGEGNRVRMFDSAGTELWRFGQRGEGPADFHGLSWPCRMGGDTVVAIDQGNRRIVYLEPGVGVIATVPAATVNLREGACNGRGTFITFRFDRDTITDSGQMLVELRATPADSPRVIHREPSVSGLVVGHGETWTGAVDTFVYVTNPDEATITLRDRSGRFVRQLVWAVPRDPVTDDNIPDRFGMVPGGATGDELKAWWDRVRGMKRMDDWPAFAQVAADADGRLWVIERYDEPEDMRQYWVVTRTGRVLAKVRFPFGHDHFVQLLGFVEGGIVIQHRDADGAPHFSVIPYPDGLRP